MSIRLFLKFGSKQNIQKLIENGEVYFSSLEEFRVIKNSKNRDDSYEGTLSLKHFSKEDKYTLKINPNKDNEIKIHINKGELKTFLPDIKEKVLSLYSIKYGDVFQKDFKIDERIIRDTKYEYCVIITNPIEFLNRVTKELDKREISFRGKSIKYLDYNIDQNSLDLFSKSKEFNYQNEYRIVLYNIDFRDYKLYIGNIEDIAVIYKTKNLKAISIS